MGTSKQSKKKLMGFVGPYLTLLFNKHSKEPDISRGQEKMGFFQQDSDVRLGELQRFHFIHNLLIIVLDAFSRRCEEEGSLI